MFTFLIFTILELFTRKVCIFAKKLATFQRILFLRVRKQTFRQLQSIVFMWTQTHIGRFPNLQ